MRTASLWTALFFLVGCGGSTRLPGHHGPGSDGGSGFDSGSGSDGSSPIYGDGGGGCANPAACTYTVYAHSNTVLYKVDLAAKTLEVVGPFNANGDTMTDLAVAPDNTIYTVSTKNLYTADPNDGHVTLVGSIQTCGTDNVALSTTPDGKLWVGDGAGAFCEIDVSVKPPSVKQIGTLGGSLALAGDLVGIGNGTLFGTAIDKSSSATVNNNILVTIDPTTGSVIKQIGSTNAPKLYGVAYALGKVFGFTHDGSGHVVTIDPQTGQSTPYNTFNDPSTNKPISFAGAGVNSMVPPIQ